MFVNPCKVTESIMVIMCKKRDVTSRLTQNKGPYFVIVKINKIKVLILLL